MRFACVQFDIAWEDKAANHAAIERMLQAADPAIAPGTFVLLPELGDTGFSMHLERIVDDSSLPWAIGLSKRLKAFVQHGFARLAGSTTNAEPPGRNCAVIIDPDGRILADYEKVHPFSYGREAQYFSGGERIAICRCGEAVVCPFICYDLRFPELWRLAAIHEPAVEVFTLGASWPASRQAHWRALCIARAIENQAYVVAVNRVGRDPDVRYAGGSLIVSPRGDVLVEAGEEPCMLQADLDLPALREWRATFPALRDVRRELLGRTRINLSPNIG